MKKLNFDQKNSRADFAIDRVCDYLLGEEIDVFSASWVIRDINAVRAVASRESVRKISLNAIGRIQTIMKKCNCQSEELKRAKDALIEIYSFYRED